MNFWEAYLAAKDGKIIRVEHHPDDIRFAICCTTLPTNKKTFILFDLTDLNQEEEICWKFIDKYANNHPKVCVDSIDELKFSIVTEEEMFEEMRQYVKDLAEDE